MRCLFAIVACLWGVVWSTAFAAKDDPAQVEAIVNGVCATCHGMDGNSPIPANPRLAGQHPEYIFKQLKNYKSGARQNPVMSGMVAGLSDDDMRNLAAYFSGQKPKPGSAKDRDLVARGQKLYRGGNVGNGVAACAGCHSPNGAGIPAQYPRLSGQHSEYTLAQLQAFRSGARANDSGSTMRTIAARMSEHEMTAVAEYLSGLK